MLKLSHALNPPQRIPPIVLGRVQGQSFIVFGSVVKKIRFARFFEDAVQNLHTF